MGRKSGEAGVVRLVWSEAKAHFHIPLQESLGARVEAHPILLLLLSLGDRLYSSALPKVNS